MTIWSIISVVGYLSELVKLAELSSAVGSMSDYRYRDCEFKAQAGHITCVEIDYSHFPPPTDTKRPAVSYWLKYMHLVLVNHLRGPCLPRDLVSRLTDHCNMTEILLLPRKAKIKQPTSR